MWKLIFSWWFPERQDDRFGSLTDMGEELSVESIGIEGLNRV
jgi:hypothetical protein